LVLEGRLHPLTLAVVLLEAVRNFIIPAVIVFATGSQRSLGLMLVVFLGLNLVQAILRYVTFSYRIQGGELVTRQGVFERRERHIPLARVQDLRQEQGLIHRLLGVVELHVETAGGQGAEASLSVLSRSEADNLRRAVFDQGADLRRAAGAEVPAVGDVAPTALLRRLTLRELVLAGLTSNQAASALLIVLAGWQFLDDFLPEATYQRVLSGLASQLERWVSEGAHGHWLAIGAGAIALIGLGLLISVAGSVMLFHGFTLARRGEDLHRSYGLLTRRSSSLPRRRIQVLQIEQNWLRRCFKLATLRADTAGSRAPNQQPGREGHDVLLPVLPRHELEGLLPELLPDLELAPPAWHRVSRCAVRRGTAKGAAICIVVAAASGLLQRHYWAFWPLALVPLIYLLNVFTYRHLGYALSARFFRTRRGWLNRTTHLVPIRNTQALVVRQTPFDRRFGVATLLVDTAGQAYTGGGPHLRNVPLAEAEAVARRVAVQAARTRYRC
jgi:putative membrane protein